VYAYFGDKEAVYLACLRRARIELEEMLLAAAATAKTARETLEQATGAYFEFVERRGQRWAVLFDGAGLSASGAEEAARLRFATVGRIRDLLGALAPEAEAGAVEAFAHAISGSSEQMAKWWRANPQYSRADVAGYQVAYAWSGLGQLFGGSGDGARADPREALQAVGLSPA
jgi:AcrR family transcriptional regulator